MDAPHTPSTGSTRKLLKLSSGSPRWLGDREAEVLLKLLANAEVFTSWTFSPSFLVQEGLCKDRKVAYVYVQRLVRKGLVEKVGRGLYRVIVERVREVLGKLPVRSISKRGRGAVRRPGGTRGLRASLPPTVLPTATGRPAVRGPFLDNVRYYVGGLYREKPRAELWGLHHLESVDRAVYFEVAYFVDSLVVDGCVVVYTNVDQSPGSAKVEWRPPSGFVARNGAAATLSTARREYEVAFRALAYVLAEVRSREYLGRLYEWLGRVWGLGPAT